MRGHALTEERIDAILRDILNSPKNCPRCGMRMSFAGVYRMVAEKHAVNFSTVEKLVTKARRKV